MYRDLSQALDQKLVLPLTHSSRDIVSLLITRGLLSAAEIIDHGVKVQSFERKNLSFSVRTPRRSCLVKLARQPEDNSITREAAVYAALSAAAAATPLLTHLPRVIDYDPDRKILVLEWIEGHTLYDHHRLREAPHPHLGRQSGEILHYLHGLDPTAFADLAMDSPRPWILRFDAPPVHILATESSGILHLARLIQTDDTLLRAMRTVAESWKVDALCHNDFRLNNVLHAPESGKEGAPSKVYLIDWELCAPGYALWDLVSFFESYVQLWVLGKSSLREPEAAVSITHFQRLIGAFWEAYRSRESAPGGDRLRTITLVANMIGLKLLQSALEYAQRSNEPTRESVMLLECGRKFCTHPLEAWVHILGIPLTRKTGAFHNASTLI